MKLFPQWQAVHSKFLRYKVTDVVGIRWFSYAKSSQPWVWTCWVWRARRDEIPKFLMWISGLHCQEMALHCDSCNWTRCEWTLLEKETRRKPRTWGNSCASGACHGRGLAVSISMCGTIHDRPWRTQGPRAPAKSHGDRPAARCSMMHPIPKWQLSWANDYTVCPTRLATPILVCLFFTMKSSSRSIFWCQGLCGSCLKKDLQVVQKRVWLAKPVKPRDLKQSVETRLEEVRLHWFCGWRKSG